MNWSNAQDSVDRRVSLITDSPVADPPTGDDIVTSQWVEALRAVADGRTWTIHGQDDSVANGAIATTSLALETANRAGVFWRWLVRGEPLLCARYNNSNIAAIRAMMARERYNIVLLNHFRVASQMPRLLGSGSQLVYLAHNCECVAHESLAKIEPRRWRRIALLREARLLRKRESDVVQRADAVVTLTEEDACRFDSMGARVRPITIPPWVSVPSWEWRESGSMNVLLVGSFTWHAKRANAVWLAREVFPKVLAAIPTAQLCFVGKGATALERHLRGIRGIRIHPDVLTTADFLKNAAVFANPERQQGGIKLKTLEAAAAGLPIVSTTAGVEGTALRSGSHCLVADSSDDFAVALIELLRSRARASVMGASARALVMQQFSHAGFLERVKGLLGGMST